MTIPKWLLPVLAIVAAVAVGVAAVLIGMRFTPATTPTLATEAAPVIAPAAPTDGDSPFDVSPVVGEQQIVTPGQQGVSQIDAGAQAQIDDLNAHDGIAPNPPADSGSVPGAGSGSGADDPGTPLAADDPCATSDPPSGCPLGVTGIVLADMHIPELRSLIIHPAPGTSASTGAYCPSESTPGNIWIDVLSFAPGDITVTYAPVGNPAAEHTVTFSTSAEQRRPWDAYTAAHHDYAPLWGFQNCTQLTGLAPGRYTVTASAVDIFGRSPLPSVATFDSRGPAIEPPMTATPLGNALLYVSVPSPGPVGDPRPTIRAWVVAPDEPADCTTFDSHAELRTLAPQAAYSVDAAWLTSQNYDPSYRSRDTVVYSVPEGSQIVVCARWYRTTSHSWESHVSRQRAIVASSPDTVTPTISIESIDLARQVQPNTLRVSVSMPGGVGCGTEWDGPDAAAGPGSIEPGAAICDAGAQGFDGRLVVTTGVNLADHGADPNWAQTSAVLQLERRQCTGTCVVPEYSNYLVSLASVTHGTGLCGSGFGGDCTPPSETTSLGRVVLRVTWSQGRSTGLSGWRVGPVDPTPPGGPADPAPQFDTTVFPAVGHSTDGFSGTITLPVVTDRAAHYRATLSGGCFPAGSSPTVVTGSTVGPGPIPPDVHWTGLCDGLTYTITLELWDDAGHHATYGFPGDSSAHRWPGALVSLVARALDVTATIYTGPMAAQHNSFAVQYVEVDFGADSGLPSVAPDAAHRCVPANGQLGALHDSGQILQDHTYTVTVTVHAFNQLTAFAPTGGTAEHCGYERISQAIAVFTGTFTYNELMRPAGVQLVGDGVFTPESQTANFQTFHTSIQLNGSVRPGS